MKLVAIAIFCLFVLSICVMAMGARNFVRLLRSSRLAVEDGQLPKTAILMSVRGADPSLTDCMRSLLQQDYPNYSLQIVVDSEDDPAWAPISRIIRESGATNVNVMSLQERYQTCSLKCSALVQGVAALDDSYEVITVVDSDVVVYPSWLREMVAPMACDPKIGVTSGTRWYMPDDANLGSLVRYLYNISSAASMYKYQCPWGGAMAIRRSVFREGNLLEIWKQVLSDDNTAASAACSMGLALDFVPTVILVNREQCDLPGFWRFSKRQFLWTRLYGSFWNEISVQVGCRLTLLTSAFLMIPLTLWSGNSEALAWIGRGFAVYGLGLVMMVSILELSARRVLAARGEVGYRFSPLKLVQILMALPVAHAMGIASLLASIGMREVEWRGANYKIRNSYDVSLTNYQSFEARNASAELETSIL